MHRSLAHEHDATNNACMHAMHATRGQILEFSKSIEIDGHQMRTQFCSLFARLISHQPAVLFSQN
jgi:hypothetical protein